MQLQADEKAVHPLGDVTVLLQSVSSGEQGAFAKLIDLLYPDLKLLAERSMRRERPNHTLQPTALVNEFFLEMAGTRAVQWKNRAHFLAVASLAMRRFLIDHARSDKSIRRGGQVRAIHLPDLGLAPGFFDAIVVDEALNRLAEEEPRMAKVVELRCFGGLTHAEIGEVLGFEGRTMKRDWQVARAWLRKELGRKSSRDDT